MIAYLDSSVILRVVLGQGGRLEEWDEIRTGVASALVQVECLRTLDRLRFQTALPVDQLTALREAVFRLTEELHVVELSPVVLDRASQPFATPLGTLDAFHLTTAMLWREMRGEEIVMATHDRALATAARASGLRAIGV